MLPSSIEKVPGLSLNFQPLKDFPSNNGIHPFLCFIEFEVEHAAKMLDNAIVTTNFTIDVAEECFILFIF
jgi:hypothetical protein